MIRRGPRSNEDDPEERLAIDFHDFKAVIKVLIFFFDYLKRQYKIKPKMMKMNRKLYTQKSEIRRFLEQQFIRVEPSPSHMQALNGSGECSGNVIKQKIIVMESSSNL